MTWFEQRILHIKRQEAIRRLRREYSRALSREGCDEAADLAQEIIALDPALILGWHLKAAALVRKCPSRPPNPDYERAAVAAYREAFRRDRSNYAIAWCFMAFLNWLGDHATARQVVADFQGARKGKLEEQWKGFVTHTRSTRGLSRMRNEATGAVEEGRCSADRGK